MMNLAKAARRYEGVCGTTLFRASAVAAMMLLLTVACSSSTGGSSSTAGAPSVSCRQKPTSDTDKDCAATPTRPRKLDCESSETASAVNAGCMPTSPGDHDVCCPTNVTGTEAATTDVTVPCTQKTGSDTDKDCAGTPSSPRKLDCDVSQTAVAVAAGCTPTKPGDSDVCCPTAISGEPPDGG